MTNHTHLHKVLESRQGWDSDRENKARVEQLKRTGNTCTTLAQMELHGRKISIKQTLTGWAVSVDNGLTILTHHYTCLASAVGRYNREKWG
jgi:hypothetical protein